MATVRVIENVYLKTQRFYDISQYIHNSKLSQQQAKLGAV